MLRVYSDFNCPFCFVQHSRIMQLGLESNVEWRFIEHAPNLSSSVHNHQAMQALDVEFSLIQQRAPDVSINKPEFCVNTRLAILSFISIQISHPHIAYAYLSKLYEAYWQQGKDISDTIVLRGILSHFDINDLDFHDHAEELQNLWQQHWRCGDFNERIPVISSSKNRLLLGLQHVDNIHNFCSNSPEVKLDLGAACSPQEKSHLAILSGTLTISEKIISPSFFDLHFFTGLNDLIKNMANNRPDLIIVDFELDKSKNFQTIELLKKIPSSALKDVPIIYYFNQTCKHPDLAVPYTLGAIDSFSWSDDFSLIHAKLKRRAIDSRKLLQLSQHSTIDSLTGTYNRREFNLLFEKLWRISCRKKLPLSIVMVDIDYFKQYNDHYGHLSGDDCLVKVASILKKNAQRTSDIVSRFGGEEFVILLFDIEADIAEEVVQSMETDLETANITHTNRELPHRVTVSFGIISLFPHPDISPTQALGLADQAMYRAKTQGRNLIYSERSVPLTYETQNIVDR